ncbi:GIY-YIG nuclease family protein [Rhizobium sp. L1K21]|uniref:GIY-YIG nuclease family protein n=1 Tax=Rhizobium sp. L1K21 TaxID=2954933 RepID=UPI00209371B9|nr:GIY-YIG nuclease family protein [Rhizobium sp. L1K21]MCO6186301.1 GIY-YIG nuclease family protein [Rhizobium sp. L1K21]
MELDLVRQEILNSIKSIAADNGGRPPGMTKFESVTGIKKHEWRSRIWRNWSDALIEAGFIPNTLQKAYSDEELLDTVLQVSEKLGRFPTTGDLDYEVPRLGSHVSPKTIQARWPMPKLAERLAEFAMQKGKTKIAELARKYQKPVDGLISEGNEASAKGYVYLQKHGSDYKIGYTTSLNKRGRQVQIELPQEIELVHSILTDDPQGVEFYWHKRFADKRTRGEWFRLTKSEIAAFKRWRKIW